MKKILLLPTYHYLSNPLYTSLYKLLKDDFKFIYFFSKDSTMIKGNLDNITEEKIGYIFDEYIELNYDAPWVKRVHAKKSKVQLQSSRKGATNTSIYYKSDITEQFIVLNNKESTNEEPGVLEKIITDKDPDETLWSLKNKNILLNILNLILYFIVVIFKKIKRFSIRVLRKTKYTSIRILSKITRPIRRYKNIWIITRDIHQYGLEVKKIIQSVSPDIIIMTSDMTISYRVIKKYFPNIQIVIIQPCFLDFRTKKKRFSSNIDKIKNFIAGNILYPKQQYFGMENNKDKLLLIEDRFLEFYKNKRNNTYKIVNPYFHQLNKDIIKLKEPHIRKEFLKMLNLDLEKKVIIIFITDYTLIHGAEVQKYVEDTYKKIIYTYNNKYNFIVKNHPRSGVKKFENNFLNIPHLSFITNELTFTQLLSIGDLNISINSNASLESIISGMCTLNFLPLHLKNDEHHKWLTYYGGINVSTYEEIIDFLDSFDKNNLENHISTGRTKLIGEGDECKDILLSILS